MRRAHAETQPPGGAESLSKSDVAALLAEARGRTLDLVEPVREQDMNRIHHPLMSPLVWDLGHIAAFEDLWLCQRLGGLESLRPDLADVYDAAETPRAVRGATPHLRLSEAREYMAAVRERALHVLDAADLSERGDPPNRGGLVWDMVVQHEHQHNETMLQTLALAEPGVYVPHRRPAPPDEQIEAGGDALLVDAGPFPLGIEGGGFAYDNERPRHDVELPPFEIDRHPVSNGEYLDFVEEGGYRRREWWSDDGWSWKEREGAARPLYWTADGMERSFDRLDPIDPRLPVMHVSWYEAEAYARSRGKRLPTEAEWERAASWDGREAAKRRYPWGDDPAFQGRANLDQLSFGPSPAGAYPDGASPCGALGMLGDAWEWTASDFTAYPGFRAFPYREYSEVFFGSSYKVLRGGSWATRPRVVRNTHRNWDLPARRQIHSGFRCARDV